MSIKITYFVHGTTTDNEAGLSTGWLPGELSELGVKRSKEVPNQIGNKQFDAIFSSDLKRAIDSARLNFMGRKIIQDERLRECNYGELNGANDELVSYEDHIETPFSGGESLIDVEKRVRSFCKFLSENYDGNNIAIVAHKAPQLALQVICEGVSWSDAIKNDWRKIGKWQPGWDYSISGTKQPTPQPTTHANCNKHKPPHRPPNQQA